ETVSRAEDLRALLRELKLETAYAAAAEWLGKEPEFKKSVADDRAPLVTARALVARMVQLIGADSNESFSPLKTDPELRDELVKAIAKALTEQQYGVISKLLGPVIKPLAAGLGTFYARRHRGDLS